MRLSLLEYPKFLTTGLVAVTLFLDFVAAERAEPGGVMNSELAETDWVRSVFLNLCETAAR